MEKTENKKISAESILSSLWRILLGAIIAILVLVAGTLAYDKFVKKSPIPSIFGKSLLIIATPSMTGSIEAGDAIIIKKSDDYAVGDVITYFPADEVMVAGKPDEEYAETSEEISGAGGEDAEAYAGIAVKNAETATPHDEAETREDESAAEKDVDR